MQSEEAIQYLGARSISASQIPQEVNKSRISADDDGKIVSTTHSIELALPDEMDSNQSSNDDNVSVSQNDSKRQHE